MRLLDVASATAILPQASAESLQQVYIEYRTRLHRLALEKGSYLLAADDYERERQQVLAIWESLFGTAPPENSSKNSSEQREPPGAA